MNFASLPAGAAVFLDTNVLIYHFTREPAFGPACTALVKRIEEQQVAGYTSTHAISELAHRLMTIEAADTFGWPFAGIGRRLKRHPLDVQKLIAYRHALDAVPLLRIQVLAISMPIVASAAGISQQIGLLSGDALVVAVMQANGLIHLASQDGDFDRVPGVIRCSAV